MNMIKKKLGIIGGMGSEATVNMFKSVVDNTLVSCDQDHIEIIIHNNTNIPDRTRAIIYNEDTPVKEILRSIKIMEKCEVDLIIIPCMTSHFYYPEFEKSTKIRILNAIDETISFIKEKYLNIEYIGLLATTGTIKSSIFQKELLKANIVTIIPSDEDQSNIVMDAIYGEMGIKTIGGCKTSKERLIGAANQLVLRGAQGIIAGCTEIPLVLTESDLSVPLINPVEIMAKKTIELCGGSLNYR